jgi:hypothetical protein
MNPELRRELLAMNARHQQNCRLSVYAILVVDLAALLYDTLNGQYVHGLMLVFVLGALVWMRRTAESELPFDRAQHPCALRPEGNTCLTPSIVWLPPPAPAAASAASGGADTAVSDHRKCKRMRAQLTCDAFTQGTTGKDLKKMPRRSMTTWRSSSASRSRL